MGQESGTHLDGKHDHVHPKKIAVIAGDGIGKEVMPEGLRALEAAAKPAAAGVPPFRLGPLRLLRRTRPDDARRLEGPALGMDAIFFGAVGWPATVPDHVSLWGSLLKFRREFDQYINLRPVRLFEGVPCPLAGRKPGDIDYYVVRENTEGEYTALGGIMFEGTDREICIQESVYSKHGAERLLKYAFDLAQSRSQKHVTLATKSNGIAISMPWWDKQADDVPGLPRSHAGQAAHRHPDRALCAAAGPLRCGGRHQSVRRHPPTWARPPPAPSAWLRRPT
jgi:tartrate dehydrogenase/decarboxylase/D-malate dehydrogenase